MFKKTKMLSIHKEDDIQEAISLIEKGELVAVPTETVYGLAADARNSDAVKKIFTVKNRPSNHPLIVHIASFKKLSEWAKDIPPLAEVIAKKFWPGPITLLLKKNDNVNDIVTGGLDTIALRVPQNNALLKILTELDTGLAAPSANPHKRISPTTAEHVMNGLSGKIVAVLDGGPCQVGLESTILDLTQDTIKILRPGPITKKMLEDALKITIELPSLHTEKVAGNMKTHYQPYTKTLLMTIKEIEQYLSINENQDKIFGVIHYSTLTSVNKNITTKKMPATKKEYAQLCYQSLHELDSIKAYQILVETPPDEESWSDILDRLSKASTHDKN